MFTWKRLFLSLGFLFLIVIIGWGTWYFTIPRSTLMVKPKTIYNTNPQLTVDDFPDSSEVKTHQTAEYDTSESQNPPKVKSRLIREGNSNEESSSTQKELDKHIHQSPNSNDKKLSDEEFATRRATAEKEMNKINDQVNELSYSLNELKRQAEKLNASYNEDEIRAILVLRLNALSTEEQKAYFDDIKSGKAVDDTLETVKTTFKEGGIPDSFIEVFFELLKPQLAQELDAEKHLEELRAHGFKPKF